jgi:peptidyl-prolyl cis-trans isomerase A (cyclophilin A)
MSKTFMGLLFMASALLACENRQDPQAQTESAASLAQGRDVEAARPETPRPEKSAGAREREDLDVADDEIGKAPERFAVKLETTKGDIVIDVTRSWAPQGADRFHELVKAGYYDDCSFFRVIKGFMAQVGISGDPAANGVWRAKRIPDDPVRESNKRGRVTFAMAGPNTRTTQIFINFGDNSQLDDMGFAPFGQVRDMNTVDKLFSGYGEGAPRGKGPSQPRLQSEGNTYLKAEFPNLDYITKASLLQ